MKKSFFKIVTIAIAMTFSLSAQAEERTGGFIAPSINGEANVGDPFQGEIIFDTAVSKFKGRTSSSWVEFAGTNSVVSTNSNQRIERLSITTNCSSDPCTADQDSGNWYEDSSSTAGQFDWIATGTYTINFAPGKFTGVPTCVCSTDPGYVSCGTTTTSTDVTVLIRSTTTATSANYPFRVICMGPA